ncbi:poly(ethylene terephthalate) hydrolase family protein [Angustibacter luteus]|uniref:Dienelactone hydrolase family protein n=1 Tax=Angustibacter luteus TaxID=658456 RepID=A0ABW1JGV8_9ACTN
MRRHRNVLTALATAAAVGLVVTTATTGAATVDREVPRAAANPYERGPAPTTASIEATRGSFAVAQTTVARSAVSGFGGGTITYPTSTAQGTFGAVALSPGFTSSQSALSWLGPRLASQGFVVIVIDTLSVYDQPASRGTQLLAALDYLTKSSSVRTRIDPTRLAVGGHSMGGGGAIEATAKRPTLQASVPLTPWDTTKTWSSVRVPTLIFGGERDTTAPVASHAERFYASMTNAPDKAYLERRGASHGFPTSADTTTAKYTIAWLKRFVDDDTRYDQFLCPAPAPSTLILEYRDTCPHA